MRWRQREATGDMIIVRYADDFIIGFQHESDARRFFSSWSSYPLWSPGEQSAGCTDAFIAAD